MSANFRSHRSSAYGSLIILKLGATGLFATISSSSNETTGSDGLERREKIKTPGLKRKVEIVIFYLAQCRIIVHKRIIAIVIVNIVEYILRLWIQLL